MRQRGRANLRVLLANAGQFDKAQDWASWAVAHDYRRFLLGEGPIPRGPTISPADSKEALEALKGVEATHQWPVMMIYVQLGRLDEAKAAAAEWAKTGFHSVLAETCMPIREPMKQKYLDDLRKAGIPEHAERASP